MKRKSSRLRFLLLFFLLIGLFYGLWNRNDQGSPLGNLWNSVFREERKLPTINPEANKRVDPSLSTPLRSSEASENLNYDERLAKGDYFFEKGFYSFANNEYAQAADSEPKRPEPYLKLTESYLKLLNYDEALANVQKLLQLEPGNEEAQLLQATISIKKSDFAGAKTLLEAMTPSPALSAKVTYYKALLESVYGNHETARKLFDQAKLGNAELELNTKIELFTQAYQEFDLAEQAEGAYLQQLLARAYNESKEYAMTVYTMKELLKTRSDLRDAWILYGFAYLNLGQPAFAKTAFERAYQLDSTWNPTQFFLALTHKELGNKEEAVKFLNFALANQFEPEIVAQQYLADLLFDVANYKAAARAYQRVIELNNKDLNAFVRPIWLYLDFLNEPDQALALAEIAIALFPKEAMAYNLLGWSQTGTGDYIEAEKNLSQAIVLDPNLAAAHYNLGRLYQVQDEKASALASYEKAYQADQNGSIGNLAAQAYNDLLSGKDDQEEE